LTIDRSSLQTETQNPKTIEIDKLSTSEILKIMNQEDRKISAAVQKVIPEIKRTIDLTLAALKRGNRIVYIGAGTSGRLGILDASEIPPTFSAPSEWFTGVIAGGREAVYKSIEGAEDLPQNAQKDLDKIGLKQGDVLIGIASSGTTPYVIAGLQYGQQLGCATVFLLCNPTPADEYGFDVVIPAEVGPEIITGSTRLKAGTATKLILNMISTATMIKMGKVYGNLMVDLQVVNKKLADRGTRIITQLTNLNYNDAGNLLQDAKGSVKTAVVMNKKQCSRIQARELLKKHAGNLRLLIGDISA